MTDATETTDKQQLFATCYFLLAGMRLVTCCWLAASYSQLAATYKLVAMSDFLLAAQIAAARPVVCRHGIHALARSGLVSLSHSYRIPFKQMFYQSPIKVRTNSYQNPHQYARSHSLS